jgi:hypothetical protein
LKPEPDWRTIVSYTDMHVVEGQRIATVGETDQAANALRYYSRIFGSDRRRLAVDGQDGGTTDRIILVRQVEGHARLLAEARSGRGVWLIVWGLRDGKPLPLPAVLASCTVEKRLSPGGTVFVYYVSRCDR